MVGSLEQMLSFIKKKTKKQRDVIHNGDKPLRRSKYVTRNRDSKAGCVHCRSPYMPYMFYKALMVSFWKIFCELSIKQKQFLTHIVTDFPPPFPSLPAPSTPAPLPPLPPSSPTLRPLSTPS